MDEAPMTNSHTQGPDAAVYRNLNQDERQDLVRNGCTAADWEQVEVEDPFDPARFVRADFSGSIRIGRQSGSVTHDGVVKPAGVYDAAIFNVTLGREVRIANIGVHLANYDIGDGACVEDVGTMVTHPAATFGNGVKVAVLNEAGGREVILFNELSAQFAYLQCLYRYRPALIEKLMAMANAYVAAQRRDRGRIGANALVASVSLLQDVYIGDSAWIQGVAELRNGTVLSTPDAKTCVGSHVQAEDFIIAEGARVTGGAMLSACYVGQGCQLGRQFSAENCLFFANCECFHGEAVSVFAGPYTVTHHKSTLLIAGVLSFYNAGSGTNQSNHMYKLGPVHEGKLERGCKTGSYAYLMWPCRVGPFSVVLGKHKRQFDTSLFPFSLIDASADGQCNLVPGLNLGTVGTIRDGRKWPARDRRHSNFQRDRVSFDVLSPYTVGRMLLGSEILEKLQRETDKSVDKVAIRGAIVKRVLLRTGQKLYRTGIEIYLLDRIVTRAEQVIAAGGLLTDAMAATADARVSQTWLDVGGQLMPQCRLDKVIKSVSSGAIHDVDSFAAAFQAIEMQYTEDEWAWVRQAYQRVFDRDVAKITKDDLVVAADDLLKVKGKFIRQVLGDAQKEFENTIGFGQDGGEEDVQKDFVEVRGTYEQNEFVKEMRDDLVALEIRMADFKSSLNSRQETLS